MADGPRKFAELRKEITADPIRAERLDHTRAEVNKAYDAHDNVLEIFQDPDNPHVLRISRDGGDAGIMEVNADYEGTTEVNEVPEHWRRLWPPVGEAPPATVAEGLVWSYPTEETASGRGAHSTERDPDDEWESWQACFRTASNFLDAGRRNLSDARDCLENTPLELTELATRALVPAKRSISNARIAVDNAKHVLSTTLDADKA